MRRRLAWVLVLALLLAAGCTAIAMAKWDVFRAGNVILKFDGGAVPNTLPRHRPVPIGVFGRVQIATSDGTHPPAFRGGVFEVDRNARIDGRGLPVCQGKQLEARDSRAARQACGAAIVGKGTGTVEIAFPEQRPILVTSPLTFFNGGVKGRTTTLFVHAFITVPTPAALVTTVKMTEVNAGRYGLRVVSQIPVVAGGAGSLLSASFNLKRLFTYKGEQHSYLSGQCPDGRLLFRVVKTDFKVEAVGLPSAPALSGALVRPCIPRG